MELNFVSLSGGKDSTALALLSIEKEADARFIFCDTGNESPKTYAYIDYLDEKLESMTGRKIIRIKADFSREITLKQQKLITAGETERAEACTPTGIPFLDLAVLKGRFPSTMARFCTQKLKVEVVIKEFSKYLQEGHDVKDWVGIRADESTRRAKMPEMELFLTDDQTGCEAWHYRPILKWTANDCFEMMKRHGVEPNPLYKEGFSRVGCFPCISCRKEELRIIAEKYPGVIDRLNDWEVKVGRASKRGGRSTFFTITSTNKTIYDFAEWAKTARGGKQYQLDIDDISACKSVYGLCE